MMARKLSSIAGRGVALLLIIALSLVANGARGEQAAGARRKSVTYQNPFANRPKGPPIEMPLRPGPISRWRRSLATVVEPTATMPAEALSSPVNSLQPEPPSWDQLPPAEHLRPLRINAIEKSIEKTNAPAAVSIANTPEPIAIALQPLLQPTWLTATDDSAEDMAIERPIKDILFGGQQETMEISDPLLAAFDIDSLELPVEEPQVIVAEAISPEKMLREAQEVALESETIDELTTVAELCQCALAAATEPEMSGALGRLAAWAHNRRGELFSESGSQQEALDDFQAAITLDPNCSLAIHNRAVTFGQKNQFAAALRDFNKVIELNPGLAIAYRNRAELLAALGRMDDAALDYGRAIEGLPDDATLLRARAYVLQRMGEFDKALADLNHSIKLDNNDPDSVTQRGNLAAERGDFEQALSDFDRAMTIDPNWAEAHRSLAWLRATCVDPTYRDPQQAIAEAERAAELSPANDYLVLDTLAAANALLQRYDQAADLQRKALAAAPADLADPLRHRLNLYEQGTSQPHRRIEPMVRPASLNEPSDER